MKLSAYQRGEWMREVEAGHGNGGALMSRSDDKIGKFCRRLKERLGKAEAMAATAHKLARIKSDQAYNEALKRSRSPSRYKRNTSSTFKNKPTASASNLVPAV
ncbi:MAG: hypothetical protein V4662_01645 [Verrucomicrobiota bacterium]